MNIALTAKMNGQTVAQANAEDLDDARYLAHNLLRNGDADVVELDTPGQPTRRIYS
jgi:hypothetical protein